MAKKKKIWITFLLDMTGSMAPYLEDAIGGFNTYVEKMREDKSAHYFMTLVLFNSQNYENTVFDRLPIADVPELDKAIYRPDGMTPLLDAFGMTMERVSDFVSDDKDRTFGIRKQNVLLAIMTDGEENFSKRFNRTQVAEMIEDREKKGWGVLFMGANIDSFAEAGSMGVQQDATADFDQKHTGQAFASMASASVGYAGSGKAVISDEDKEKIK